MQKKILIVKILFGQVIGNTFGRRFFLFGGNRTFIAIAGIAVIIADNNNAGYGEWLPVNKPITHRKKIQQKQHQQNREVSAGYFEGCYFPGTLHVWVQI